MSKIFILAFWLIIAIHQIFAQNSNEQEILPRNCEVNDVILNATHQGVGENSLIILIARLGDGETSAELNRRRLFNAKTYFTSSWKRDPKTIVVAQGERVKGYGRIEIYVNGNLLDVIAVPKNRDLLVGTCDGEDNRFYPDLEKEKPRSKKLKRNGRSKRRN